jgi:hypothetical protein
MVSPEEENTFRKRGDYWEVVFKGKQTHLKDIHGARYIAFLLAYPERKFPVLDLVAAVRHQDIRKVKG